ncbi:hypothetical protein [Metallibacterium sp.]|jgi:hypothetical protein|uniref:hypothetical protein n=1 Tax=Metallibacterium sp. TaxID=2940281 RepID=UPI00261EF81C|nr:hypothetical protein [Metallibacterium sp.]
MHLLIHDYGGHVFIVQLARAARASRDAAVASNPTTPKGRLTRRGDDPDTLVIGGIALPRPVDKRAFVRRWRLECLYGRCLAARVAALRPDVVMCANAPLDAVRALDAACHAQGMPWDASKPDGTPRKLLDVSKLHGRGGDVPVVSAAPRQRQGGGVGAQRGRAGLASA